MAKGTVKFFNTRKGYGFITPDDGSSDVFVHMSAIIVDDEEYATLNQYDEVTYEITQGQKGPQASNVVVTKKAPPQHRPNPQPRGGGGYDRSGGYSRDYGGGKGKGGGKKRGGKKRGGKKRGGYKSGPKKDVEFERSKDF